MEEQVGVVVVLSALCFWRNDREQHALLVPLYGGGRMWAGAELVWL